MADTSDSVSSLDENTQDAGNIRNEGPVPYGYHPVCEARSPMSSASLSNSGSADADLVADADDGDGDSHAHGQEPSSRVGNVDWCRCGNFIEMATHTESLC